VKVEETKSLSLGELDFLVVFSFLGLVHVFRCLYLDKAFIEDESDWIDKEAMEDDSNIG